MFRKSEILIHLQMTSEIRFSSVAHFQWMVAIQHDLENDTNNDIFSQSIGIVIESIQHIYFSLSRNIATNHQ